MRRVQTAQSARDRACPFRMPQVSTHVVPLCIADQCMAWQSAPVRHDDAEPEMGYCLRLHKED